MNAAAPPAGGRPDPGLRPARALRAWSRRAAAAPPTPRSSASTPPPTSPPCAATAPTPALAATWEAGQWGLAAGGDTPAFAGMHEAAAAVCGASMEAALAVWDGRADQSFVCGRRAPPRHGQPGRGLLRLQRHGRRDPGAARRGRRAGGLHRHRRPPRRRHPVDLLRGAARADVLGARDRPLPVPRHGRDGRAGHRRGRGDLDQRPAAAQRGRPALPEGDRGGHRRRRCSTSRRT